MYCKHCTCTHSTVSCINIYNILGKYTIITNPPPRCWFTYLQLLWIINSIPCQLPCHHMSGVLPSVVRSPAILYHGSCHPLSGALPSVVRSPAILCQGPFHPLSGVLPTYICQGPCHSLSGALPSSVSRPVILCKRP